MRNAAAQIACIYRLGIVLHRQPAFFQRPQSSGTHFLFHKTAFVGKFNLHRLLLLRHIAKPLPTFNSLVCHDCTDIDVGRVRVRIAGGHDLPQLCVKRLIGIPRLSI